jgi:hypothetical protein
VPPRPSKRAVVPADATLADFPHLAEQLHPDEGPAASISARSRLPCRWRCGKADDHVWEAPPYRRAAAGAGCPFCAGKYPSKTNSLAALCPNVAAELDPEALATAGLTADRIVAGSHRKVGWRCSTCDHRWVASVGPRTDRRKAGWDLAKTPAAQVSALARRATKRPTLVFKTPQPVRTDRVGGPPVVSEKHQDSPPGSPSCPEACPRPEHPELLQLPPFGVGMRPNVSGTLTEVPDRALFGCLSAEASTIDAAARTLASSKNRAS